MDSGSYQNQCWVFVKKIHKTHLTEILGAMTIVQIY